MQIGYLDMSKEVTICYVIQYIEAFYRVDICLGGNLPYIQHYPLTALNHIIIYLP